MADVNLTQADADALLAMEKHKIDDSVYDYPSLGGGIRIPLQSPDKRELFFLDVTRSQIKLTKGTYQNRARGVAILARVDLGERLTAIRTTKKLNVRICICIAKAMVIDGQSLCPQGVLQTLVIRGCSCKSS